MRKIAALFMAAVLIGQTGCIVTTASHYSQRSAARHQVVRLAPMIAPEGPVGAEVQVDFLQLFAKQQYMAAQEQVIQPYPVWQALGETTLYGLLAGLIYYMDRRDSRRPETYRVDTGGGDFNQVGGDGSAGSPRDWSVGE